MTGRERYIAVLERRLPDRVPIGDLAIDPAVIRGFKSGHKDALDLAIGEGIDMITEMVCFETIATHDDGTFTDEWGCRYKPNAEYVSHPVQGPVSLNTDLGRFDLPDPEAPHRLRNLENLVARSEGRVAVNFHTRVAFMWSVFLMGMDNLLMAMAVDPDFVHALFQKVADFNIQVIRRAVRAGADSISLGDDYCGNNGPMMSPEMFRLFILPHLKRAVDAIHEEGGRCIKHCDGNLWPILGDMVNTGIEAINPLEPVAGMDVAEVKAQYGDRIAIMGNIDCAELLPHGTPEEVDAAVRACIARGGEGGGLILSSSNSIHSAVKPENYRAMIQAVHRYGPYDSFGRTAAMKA
jgi:uroporphyrinogen decarboxylase